MDNYNIRKSVKIKDVSVGVYFKDNTTPPLFNLADLTRLVSSDVYLTTKALVIIAGEKNCIKLQTNMSYQIWACDFEGLCNLLRNTLPKEASDIVNSVKEFVEDQYRTLPGPLEVQTELKQIFSRKYFSLIFTNEGTPVRYVKIGNNRFFAVQDIVRSLKKRLSDVEELFETLDHSYKCNVTFRNSETRLCINEEGVRTLLKKVLPDTADSYITVLTSNCLDLESTKPTEKNFDIIIDGNNTDKSRYMISDIDDNQAVTLRYGKYTFLNFFSVTKTAQHFNVNVEESIMKAKTKKLAFVMDNDIFVSIDDLTDIFKDIKETFTYCAKLFDDIISDDIKFEAYSMTNTDHDLVLITNAQPDSKVSTTVKRFKLTKTSRSQYVIAHSNFAVKDKHVLICLTKKDPNDPNEKVTPLFWTTSIGLYIDCSRFGRIAKESFDHECCKVTLADIKKFNIKMITFTGIKQILETLKSSEDVNRIMEELKAAAEDFAREKGYIVDFGDYKQGRSTTVQEENKVTEEPKESVKEEESNLEYGEITFKDKQLDIAVAITQDKGAIIYYNVLQLCDILGVDESKLPPFNRQKDDQGNESLISIYDIPDTFGDLVRNINDITRDLFEVSKPAVAQIAARLGLKVKDSSNEKNKESEDLMTKLLNSNDSRSYTIGAVILAEKFREQLMLFKIKDINTDIVEGPENGTLLKDLWKFIDCQEPDQKVSFGFTKQVVLVSERYHRLKNIF